MRKRQLLTLLLAILLVLAMAPTSMAGSKLMEKGSVKGKYYTNPDGMSFTIPDEFELAAQRTNNLDYLRIILSGPLEHSFGPAIVIDVSTGYKDVSTYGGYELIRDVQEVPLANVDVYKDGYIINEDLKEEYGVTVLESLMVFRLDRNGLPRVAYAYCYSWSTDNYFVRAYYLCFGAQRTLTRDVEGFRELYNSMIVP